MHPNKVKKYGSMSKWVSSRKFAEMSSNYTKITYVIDSNASLEEK